MHITILEFAPCIDWLYHLRRDAEEGYAAGDGSAVTIRAGAKLRPHIAGVYAGGKATNVARVLDALLRADDRVEVELVVFRPDSAEGRYIHELQTAALARVRVRPVFISGQARLCVDLLDPLTPPEARVEFNISPRAVWTDAALASALQFADTLAAERCPDLLLLAGNPPLLESSGELASTLYAEVIERLSDGGRRRATIFSVDTEKATLANCLQASAPPQVIKINEQEHAGVDRSLWEAFAGTLVVTDRDGCTVREGRQAPTRVGGATVATLYSTLGAGDAVHAAFTLARSVWGYDAIAAARYGQAAAAAAVSRPDGTRRVSKAAVKEFFDHLQDAELQP